MFGPFEFRIPHHHPCLPILRSFVGSSFTWRPKIPMRFLLRRDGVVAKAVAAAGEGRQRSPTPQGRERIRRWRILKRNMNVRCQSPRWRLKSPRLKSPRGEPESLPRNLPLLVLLVRPPRLPSPRPSRAQQPNPRGSASRVWRRLGARKWSSPRRLPRFPKAKEVRSLNLLILLTLSARGVRPRPLPVATVQKVALRGTNGMPSRMCSTATFALVSIAPLLHMRTGLPMICCFNLSCCCVHTISHMWGD